MVRETVFPRRWLLPALRGCVLSVAASGCANGEMQWVSGSQDARVQDVVVRDAAADVRTDAARSDVVRVDAIADVREDAGNPPSDEPGPEPAVIEPSVEPTPEAGADVIAEAGPDAVLLDAAREAGADVIAEASADAVVSEAGPESGADVVASDGPVSCSGVTSRDLVINEFQTDGSGGGFDEFVEVYNPTRCTVSTSGLQLLYWGSSAGSSMASIVIGTAASGSSVGPNGFALFHGRNFTVPIAFRGPQWEMSQGLGASGGGIALTPSASDPYFYSSVAYGNATRSNPAANGTPCNAPQSNRSMGLATDGVRRATPNDDLDFVAFTSPTPGSTNR